MTTKSKDHVVADDVIGGVARKIFDLGRRILESGADPERAKFFVQIAQENVPKPCYEGSSHGTYVLESSWAWDNGHNDFIVFGLEKGDWPISCEDILSPQATEKEKEKLLQFLRDLSRSAQSGGVASSEMIRLYRVLSESHFGFRPGGYLERGTIDMHLSLKPLCDFDKGRPIPCKFSP